jgi:hypothetical protein
MCTGVEGVSEQLEKAFKNMGQSNTERKEKLIEIAQ